MRSVFLAAIVSLYALSAPANANTVVDWRWLNGTTWYVPTSGLPAYTYTPLNNNTIAPVQDQTVYTITGYRNGYFWGRTAGQIDTNDVSCMSLVGSVTPEGKIYLTFTPFPFSPGDEPTIGVGTMVRKAGKWIASCAVSSFCHCAGPADLPGSSLNQRLHAVKALCHLLCATIRSATAKVRGKVPPPACAAGN